MIEAQSTAPITLAIIAGLVFVLARLVKGVIGIGLPTVAIGLLSLVMKPVEAASLLLLPSLVTNLWQLALGPSLRPQLARLWPTLAGILVGTLLTSGTLSGDQAGRAAIGLGLALILYSGLGLGAVRFRVPEKAEPWLGPLIGLATGLVTGATGVFVIPAVPYLQALELDREDLIQALGLSFTISTLALATGLFWAGALAPGAGGSSLLIGSLLALVAALIGMAIGQWLRARISAATFRTCFFAGMLALGLHLASRAIF